MAAGSGERRHGFESVMVHIVDFCILLVSTILLPLVGLRTGCGENEMGLYGSVSLLLRFI